jgi:hypothetical protein
VHAVRVDEPERRTQARRLTFDPVVRCPAGTPVFETRGGSGCRCGIEGTTLTAKSDPSSLVTFCLGEYHLCTTWEAEKLRIEEGRMSGLLDYDPDRERAARQSDEWKETLVEQAPEIEITRFTEP